MLFPASASVSLVNCDKSRGVPGIRREEMDLMDSASSCRVSPFPVVLSEVVCFV